MGADYVGLRGCTLQRSLGDQGFLGKLKLRAYKAAIEAQVPAEQRHVVKIQVQITGRETRELDYAGICRDLETFQAGSPECASCPLSAGKPVGCYRYVTRIRSIGRSLRRRRRECESAGPARHIARRCRSGCRAPARCARRPTRPPFRRPARTPPPQQKSREPATYRVLLVEDNEMIRDMFSYGLRHSGELQEEWFLDDLSTLGVAIDGRRLFDDAHMPARDALYAVSSELFRTDNDYARLAAVLTVDAANRLLAAKLVRYVEGSLFAHALAATNAARAREMARLPRCAGRNGRHQDRSLRGPRYGH